MSLGFAANNDRVSFTGEMPPAFTLLGWVRVAVDRNDYSTFCRLRSSVEGTVATWSTDVDGLGGPAVFTTAGSIVQSTGFTVLAWRKVSFQRSAAGAGRLRVATAEGIPENDDGALSNLAPMGITFGGRGPADSSEQFNGDTAYFRCYAIDTLTDTEIDTEWMSPTAVRTDDLWADWPMVDDLLDHSGNGRHLVAGTNPVTFEDNPPVVTTVAGEVAATLPSLTAAATGGGTAEGTLAASIPGLAAALAADTVGAGALNGSLPAPTATLDGGVAATAHVTATAPLLAAAIDGDTTNSGAVDAPLSAISAGVGGDVRVLGQLAAIAPGLEAQVDTAQPSAGDIAAQLPAPAATFLAVAMADGPLHGVLPALRRDIQYRPVAAPFHAGPPAWRRGRLHAGTPTRD